MIIIEAQKTLTGVRYETRLGSFTLYRQGSNTVILEVKDVEGISIAEIPIHGPAPLNGDLVLAIREENPGRIYYELANGAGFYVLSSSFGIEFDTIKFGRFLSSSC